MILSPRRKSPRRGISPGMSFCIMPPSPSKSGFSPHFPGGFVSPQTEECSMAQPALAGPFSETDLSDEVRADPAHLMHLVCRDATTPPAGGRVGEICEGTGRHGKRPELLEQLPADVGRESGPHLAGELQLLFLIVADKQRIEGCRACRPITANHEF